MIEPNPPAIFDPTASSGVAVLDRAFALMAAFGVSDNSLTLTELSRRTGLYKSTVLRLLGALEQGGFIRKTEQGAYAIGPEPLRLAAIYQRSFRVADVIEPLLIQLIQLSGETASFYVRRNDKRVVLFRAEPARAVRFSIRVGEEFPLGQGASGKILLSFSNPVWQSVRSTEEACWAVSYGERDPETASIAVPVFGIAQEFKGALTLSGPRLRMALPETMAKNCHHVIEAAMQATLTLGGDSAIYKHSLERVGQAQFIDPLSELRNSP
jgi:DNA-binding IclR family transcriptional regulator